MASRLELQQTLEGLLGSRHVYFDPPSNIRMQYPAIVYNYSRMDSVRASNNLYYLKTAYDITLIDSNPETNVVRKLLGFPYCTYDRSYVSENLHHFTFTIYW